MHTKIKIGKALFAILVAYVFGSVISFISEKLNVLEKFTVAVNDLDFTDIYYQGTVKSNRDPRIVIVNIGHRDRIELSEMISIISAQNPRVIAADIFFDKRADSVDVIATNILVHQCQITKNLVLAAGYYKDGNREYLEHQSPRIQPYVQQGVVNLNIALDDPEYGTVRSFLPQVTIDGATYVSFGFLAAAAADSSVLQVLSESEQMIKWYGYADRGNSTEKVVFDTFDSEEVLNRKFDQDAFQNKIVLMGYLGEKLGDFQPNAVFFTPLNHKIIGRSLPDMYGVEVHANIIKMVLDKDFIFHKKWTDFAFNFTILFLFSILLSWINQKYENQYSIISKIALIAFVDIMIVLAIGIFTFSQGTIKFLLSEGLFVMLFLPDTLEFLEENIYPKLSFLSKINPPDTE